MHEKHPQKTHMLSKVADQRPANSIKISFSSGTPPHTPQKQITHPAPTKTSPQTWKVNTKQVDMKTLTLNPPWNNSLALVGNHTWKE